MTAPAAIPDREALRSCWHPVAFGDESATGPWGPTCSASRWWLRGAGGGPHADKDLCIHRGTALSLGWTEGDQIVCPYHGWRYRADGGCAPIPQLERPDQGAGQGPRRRVPCQERYGLIWVALTTPRYDLPDIPELEDPRLDR